MDDDSMQRAYHDMGGLPAGDMDKDEHDYAFWEKRVDALLVLLSREPNPIIRVDELRRGIESLGPEAYDTMHYYDRWISAILAILLEKKVITADEVQKRVETMKIQRNSAT